MKDLLTILNSKPYGFDPFKAEKMAEWLLSHWKWERIVKWLNLDDDSHQLPDWIIIKLIKDKLTTDYHTHAVGKWVKKSIQVKSGDKVYQPILLTKEMLCAGEKPKNLLQPDKGSDLIKKDKEWHKYHKAKEQVIFEGLTSKWLEENQIVLSHRYYLKSIDNFHRETGTPYNENFLNLIIGAP